MIAISPLLAVFATVFSYHCMLYVKSVRNVIFHLLFIAATMCKNGTIWSNCTECQKTCDNFQITCPSSVCKTEGCRCPEGKVFHKNTCINSYECPCYHNGKTYNELAVIQRGCNYWYVHTHWK